MSPVRKSRLIALSLVCLLIVFSAGGSDPDESPAEGEGDAEWRLPAMQAPSTGAFDEDIDQWSVIRVTGAAMNAQSTPRSTVGVPTFTTLAEAVKLAAELPDEPVRIEIAAGKHGDLGVVENVRRSIHAPIVISGALNNSGKRLTRIDGGADGVRDAGSTCIRLSNVSFIVVENIHCQRAFPHGMNIDDGSDYSSPTHHITIRNVHIRDVGLYRRTKEGTNSDCLKLSGVDDFRVLGSVFENCVSGEFIDMVGSHRGLIANNRFSDKPLNGVQTKGGSSDILIAGNVFEDIEGRSLQLGGDTAEPYYRPINAPFPAQRIRVVANVIRASPSSGVQNTVFSLNGCRDCLIAQNTVAGIGKRTSILYIDREESELPGNSRIALANNVYLIEEQDKESVLYRVSQRGRIGSAALRIDHEVFHGISSEAWYSQVSTLTVPFHRLSGIRWLDPNLDASGRPRKGSPLIQTGTPRYRHLTPVDIGNEPIPSLPSVGAYNRPAD